MQHQPGKRHRIDLDRFERVVQELVDLLQDGSLIRRCDEADVAAGPQSDSSRTELFDIFDHRSDQSTQTVCSDDNEITVPVLPRPSAIALTPLAIFDASLIADEFAKLLAVVHGRAQDLHSDDIDSDADGGGDGNVAQLCVTSVIENLHPETLVECTRRAVSAAVDLQNAVEDFREYQLPVQPSLEVDLFDSDPEWDQFILPEFACTENMTSSIARLEAAEGLEDDARKAHQSIY